MRSANSSAVPTNPDPSFRRPRRACAARIVRSGVVSTSCAPHQTTDAPLRHVLAEDPEVERGIEVETREVGLEVARLALRDPQQCGIVGVRGGRDEPIGLLRRGHERRWDREQDADVLGPAAGRDRRGVDLRPVGRDALAVERRERELDVGIGPGESEAAAEPPGEAITGSPLVKGRALSGPSKEKYSPRWCTARNRVPSA